MDSQEEEERSPVSLIVEGSYECLGRRAREQYNRLLRIARETGRVAEPREYLVRWIRRGWYAVRWAIAIYLILFAMTFFKALDPCVVKAPASVSCSSRWVIPYILQYTKVKEHFYCLVPGVMVHVENEGFNLKGCY